MIDGIGYILHEDGTVFVKDRFLKDHIGHIRYLRLSTGLKDKNGKLIFEGDLIKWLPVNVVCKIEWQQYLCGFRAVSKDNFILDYQMSAECEVVGNIYENQNLI